MNNEKITRFNETVTHRTGIVEMFNYFKAYYPHIEYEVYLRELKQRPDLLITKANGQHIALEYQCASLTYPQLANRCKGYQKARIDYRWYLGEKYLKSIPYSFLCLVSGQLVAWFWIDQRPKKVVFNSQHQLVIKQQKLSRNNLLNDLRVGIVKRKDPYFNLQKLVYRKGGNLRKLPQCCIPTQYLPLGPRQPYWFVLYMLYLQLLKGPQTKQELLNGLYMLPWHQSVFLCKDIWCEMVLDEIIDRWIKQRVVSKYGTMLILY